MQAQGCFGSSLAFAPASTACTGCGDREACSQLVDNRRPTLMRLLDKFLDAQGNTMSLGWMTRDERKALRAAEKAKELAEASVTAFGDEDGVMALKTHLDKRAHPIIDRFVKARVNPTIASLEAIGGVTACMAMVVTSLRARPHTMHELIDVVAQRTAKSASAAQRDTYATVSILTVCNRVVRSGSTLELK